MGTLAMNGLILVDLINPFVPVFVYSNTIQKQPPEVFFKKGAPKKFVNFKRKTPALESLLIKLQVSNFLKRDSNAGVFL